MVRQRCQQRCWRYNGAEKDAGLKPRLYKGNNGGEERRGWGKPHPYGCRGLAMVAWEMLARESYVVNGNAADGGLGALNGIGEK